MENNNTRSNIYASHNDSASANVFPPVLQTDEVYIDETIGETVESLNTVTDDHNEEDLLSNDTTFAELLKFFSRKSDIKDAVDKETKVKEFEAELSMVNCNVIVEHESDNEDNYNEACTVIGVAETQELVQKAKRRPGTTQLRTFSKRIARIKLNSGVLCEVFDNGYAIFDNGDRKTVVFIFDCCSYTYFFTGLRSSECEYQKKKDELGMEELGTAPWYIPIVLTGEDRIWRNIEFAKSLNTASDFEFKEEWELTLNKRWDGCASFDEPEKAYLKKEAAEMRVKALTNEQQILYRLHIELGYSYREIGAMFEIPFTTIESRVEKIRKIFKKNREKFM